MPTKMKRKGRTRIWKLEDGITQSALKLWLLCPEQFRLQYVEGWTSKYTSKPLVYGSFFHNILEEVAKHKDSSPETVNDVIDDLSQPLYQPHMTPKEVEEGLLMVGVMRALALTYYPFWEPRERNFDTLESETQFRVPIKVGVHTIYLRGMWDRIYNDKMNEDRLTVLDTKTASQIVPDVITQTLEVDFQLNFYAIAAEIHLGKKVDQLVRDIVRKPGIQQRVRETRESYLERVEDDILTRPEWYFKRWETTRTDCSTRFLNRCLLPSLRRFIAWYYRMDWKNPFASPLHWENYDAIYGKWGPCNTFAIQVRDQYNYHYQRKIPFPELGD